MTWDEFKKAVDALVKDDEELSWIDWRSDYTVEVRRYNSGAVTIFDGHEDDELEETHL